MPFSAPFGAVFNPPVHRKGGSCHVISYHLFCQFILALVPFLPPLPKQPTSKVPTSLSILSPSKFSLKIWIITAAMATAAVMMAVTLCCTNYRLLPVASSNSGCRAILHCGHPTYSKPSSESSTSTSFTFHRLSSPHTIVIPPSYQSLFVRIC
jgi:hypothetical protein